MDARIAIFASLLLAACNGSQASKAPVSATAPQKPVAVQQVLDPTKVAFMGDSITAHWDSLAAHLSNYVNSGVSGNTTPMMLARFDAVMSSNAKTVVILAGLNDIRNIPNANTNDLLAMALKASDAGRTVIIGELLPVSDWHPPVVLASDAVGQADIEQWNIQVHWMAGSYGWKVADYNAPMTVNGAQNAALFLDGLHPDSAGYDVMGAVLAPLLPAEAGWH